MDEKVKACSADLLQDQDADKANQPVIRLVSVGVVAVQILGD